MAGKDKTELARITVSPSLATRAKSWLAKPLTPLKKLPPFRLVDVACVCAVTRKPYAMRFGGWPKRMWFIKARKSDEATAAGRKTAPAPPLNFNLDGASLIGMACPYCKSNFIARCGRCFQFVCGGGRPAGEAGFTCVCGVNFPSVGPMRAMHGTTPPAVTANDTASVGLAQGPEKQKLQSSKQPSLPPGRR